MRTTAVHQSSLQAAGARRRRVLCTPARAAGGRFPRRGAGGQILRLTSSSKNPENTFKYAFCRIVLTFLESQNVSHIDMWAYALFTCRLPQNDWYRCKKRWLQNCTLPRRNSLKKSSLRRRKAPPIVFSPAAQQAPQQSLTPLNT